MKNNPYISLYGMGGYVPMPPQFPVPNMVPPEQFKQDMLARIQPQIDQYGALYNQSQKQMQVQANSGMYFKVMSFDEVKAIAPPADGKPVMIFDETNGRLYSKRFENGQTYIKGFQLVELEEHQEAQPNEAKESSQNEASGDDLLKSLLEKLDGFDKRLSAMEGEKK